jgi:hypothetical protein
MSFYRAPTSVHHGSPIKLTSPDLTRLTNALDARKEDRLNYGAEYRSLTNRLRPDIGPSVVRHERPVEKATIDLTDRRPVPGKIDTAGAIDEAAQRAEDVARVERGESLDEIPDIKSQMAHVARKAAATEVVIEKLEAEFRVEHAKLAAAYCAKIRPDHDAKTKQFLKVFGEALAIFSELQKTRQDLFDSQIGYGGLFNVDISFMNGEEVRSMFADAKAAGYVSSIPETLRV